MKPGRPSSKIGTGGTGGSANPHAFDQIRDLKITKCLMPFEIIVKKSGTHAGI